MERVEGVEKPISTKGSTGGRVQAWTVAGQVWSEHLLAGTGPGDFELEVLPRYKSAGMEYAAMHRLNAHSVYLQTLVTSGLVGLVLLMGWWGTAAQIQWSRKDWGGLGCLILLFFNGLFESLLELQQGIVAVVFVTFVLSAPNKVESQLQP
jgi:O-antigen ligase